MSFRQLNSVEDTALDAANAKCSAVERGYYVDPYIQYFVPETSRQIPPMHLGYFVRTLSMWNAITKFQAVHGDATQVVILGGGYDTLFWRLRDANVVFTRWFEVDLPFIVARKGPVIENDIFQPLDNYVLVALDLAQPGALKTGLLANQFSLELPTVFVDECTLIYIDPSAVDSIIRFATSLKSNGFISYGMVKPDDQFGKLMVRNFESIGAPLRGIAQYPTVDSHKQRFLNGGYQKVKAVDMNQAMEAVLSPSEQKRVRRIEIQDDPDELAFTLAHYVLAIASTDDEFLSILP
jgi:[phosphatase 2A protein]-leucine-carboxy methyltransferase